jgi:hypothetical protein
MLFLVIHEQTKLVVVQVITNDYNDELHLTNQRQTQQYQRSNFYRLRALRAEHVFAPVSSRHTTTGITWW